MPAPERQGPFSLSRAGSRAACSSSSGTSKRITLKRVARFGLMQPGSLAVLWFSMVWPGWWACYCAPIERRCPDEARSVRLLDSMGMDDALQRFNA